VRECEAATTHKVTEHGTHDEVVLRTERLTYLIRDCRSILGYIRKHGIAIKGHEEKKG
jgi:hypothetical protein